MKRPNWSVEEVEPRDDYTLLITFADGEKKLYDAAPLLKKKTFEPLKDVRFFMSAKAEYETVVWTDDIDIAPEHLYEYGSPL